MPIDLKSLRNTKKIKAAITAALKMEKRPQKRKRLLAVRAVLRGASCAAAARSVGSHPDAVSLWVEMLEGKNLARVLTSDARERPLNPRLRTHVKAEITAALQRHLRWRIHNRLKAINAWLSGQPPEAAAAMASVKTSTLRWWIRQIRHEGITATLEAWEAPQKFHSPPLKADPAILRAHAMREQNRHMRKHLLAMAYLAEDLSPDDAAVRVGLSAETVRRYRRRFQQGGPAALRNKPCRGGIPKLKPIELQAVASRVKQGADNSLGDLGTWIRAEFGVIYTPAGLKNMLKKQLGFQGLPP